MRISAALPTGVAALLFDEAEGRRRLESKMVEQLEGHGFSEIILPILDYLEPYEPLLTASSREELYRFADRDGQLLALRADFTPMLARLLAPRLPALGKPVRLFYRGDVVRYQEAHPGRLREYYQLGAELLGSGGREADEEILRLFLDLLSSGSKHPVQVVLGFAGALDRFFTSSPDGLELALGVARRERETARRGGPTLLRVVEQGMPENPAELGEDAAQRLVDLLALRDQLQEEFQGRGVKLSVDLAEFADNTLDPVLVNPEGKWTYYDGVVFRAYLSGSALSVGNGGRYDRLFQRVGAEISAAGFSIGVDRLAQGRNLPGPEVAP